MEKLLGLALLLHLFLVTKYCMGGMVRLADIGLREYLKWLLVIVLVPFYGYYLFLKKVAGNYQN